MAIKQLIKFNYNESIFLNNLKNKKYVRKNSINSKKDLQNACPSFSI